MHASHPCVSPMHLAGEFCQLKDALAVHASHPCVSPMHLAGEFCQLKDALAVQSGGRPFSQLEQHVNWSRNDLDGSGDLPVISA